MPHVAMMGASKPVPSLSESRRAVRGGRAGRAEYVPEHGAEGRSLDWVGAAGAPDTALLRAGTTRRTEVVPRYRRLPGNGKAVFFLKEGFKHELQVFVRVPL